MVTTLQTQAWPSSFRTDGYDPAAHDLIRTNSSVGVHTITMSPSSSPQSSPAFREASTVADGYASLREDVSPRHLVPGVRTSLTGAPSSTRATFLDRSHVPRRPNSSRILLPVNPQSRVRPCLRPGSTLDQRGIQTKFTVSRFLPFPSHS
jgi:hypothetical protein